LLLPALVVRRWTWLLRAAALILACPFELVVQCFQLSQWHFVVLGWAYGWALLLILVQFTREASVR
ncbi:MAG: hypothetical protein QME94_12410, partial [Anaerolineae bacterium]|nr:hypothetical protein [Anaerolineae bacterium]